VARTYLDAGGRAPLHPTALEAYQAAVDEGWADPRRLHSEGRRARMLLEAARQTLAEALGCRTEEVHLSGGHVPALHAAVAGVTSARRRVGPAVVASSVERSALLAAARHRGPDTLRVVPVDGAGRVDLDRWRTAVSAGDVALAVLQHANGEVGTVQPVTEAHDAARAAAVPLLVDAGASLGHAEVPGAWDVLAADPADWGGPSGVGVLAVRAGVRWSSPWPDDEERWFPGSTDVPSAFAAAVALRAVLADRAEADRARRELVQLVRTRVAQEVPDVELVGDPTGSLPHVLTFSCLYVDGEALQGELDRRGFAVGSGSACTSASEQPSHVLAAMGVLTHGNVRLVLPRGVERAEVERFCDELPDAVATVRRMIGADGL
jgi:cysteine desulfurase